MNNDLKVGIYIPTLNKPDFVLRQVKYYASLNSPHAVYIGDDSNENNAQTLQKGLVGFKNKLDINYFHSQGMANQAECQLNLISNIKEKYAVFSGDDDFLIPGSLTKCAEFLDKNLDHSLVSGLAVSFSLDRPGPYGNISSTSDYARPEVLEEKASGRLMNYLNRYHVTLFSVARTKDLKKDWELSVKAKERSFQTEIMQGCLAVTRGKAKTLDCLSIIRQMHNTRQASPDIFDWFAKHDWAETYKYFSETLAEEMAMKDNISKSLALNKVKDSMCLYIQNHLVSENKKIKKKKDCFKLMKKLIIKALPRSKDLFFKHIGFLLKKSPPLHYQIRQPWSPYYKDFKEIIKITNSA